MRPIVTLTLNPAIDGAAEAEAVHPVHKIRTSNERYYPGGGGINVSRVIAELGGAALPVYLAGGATGVLLDELMAAEGFVPRVVRIAGMTRISHAVYDRSSRLEYRFVPEGPEVSPGEWAACLAAIETLEFDWLVASGSLPRGLPDRTFAELGARVRERGARFVLDTSGAPLAAAMEAGGIALMKPSHSEMQALAGGSLHGPDAVAEAAARLCREYDVGMLAATMGHHGAILARGDRLTRVRPPDVPVRSATGAGDSFLGAMVLRLAESWTPEAAFRYGVAAGTAAVLTPGTELCRRGDVERLASLLDGGAA